MVILIIIGIILLALLFGKGDFATKLLEMILGVALFIGILLFITYKLAGGWPSF